MDIKELIEPEAQAALDDDLTDAEEIKLAPLVATIRDRFEKSKRHRNNDEIRWAKCYTNFRGLYGRETQFTDTEKSRVFIKITKTKVIAAYGQIMDVLFASGHFPLTVEPSRLPEGIPDQVHIDAKDAAASGGEAELEGDGDAQALDPNAILLQEPVFGYPGDGEERQPGETIASKLARILGLKSAKPKFKEGPAKAPDQVDFFPATVAAKRMQKKMLDQLDASDATKHVRHAVLETVLLGTGCIKGPFVERKEIPRWGEGGVYQPETKLTPRVEAVSVWNLYPDPEGLNVNDLDFIVERHKMRKSQLRALGRRPMFMAEQIEEAIADGPNWIPEWWEAEIDDNGVTEETGRWEVLEYWGVVDRDDVEEYDLPIPDELEDEKEFQINAWIVGSKLIRVVLNPFTPRRLPYHLVPYEVNPYHLFGVGLAENMEDTQTLMNGFARLAVDNAVLSGNMIIEIDETNLVPGQDMKVAPGKVFRRAGGPPGQAIFGTKWPNTTQENMLMFDRARQLADEATGIPSFSHGQTGVTGTGRTASGISMLMGAAALSVKTVIKNIDDYLLKPLGEAMYAFNMQFDYDNKITGDLEVRAQGTASLMMREVKSQRLLTFMQVSQNPATASLVKWTYLIREIAETLDLDPDKLLNNPQEAQIYASLMALAGGMGGMGGMPGPGGEAAAGANPMDPTGRGGGTMAAGGAPAPGTEEFSGNAPSPEAMMGQMREGNV